MNPYDYPIKRVASKNGNIFFARDKAKYCNFWAISFTIRMANCFLRVKTHANKPRRNARAIPMLELYEIDSTLL